MPTTAHQQQPYRYGAVYRPGDRVESHVACCYTAEQHPSVVKLGTVVDVVPGPALDVEFDDGARAYLWPADEPGWEPGSCPALKPRTVPA